MPSGSQDSEGFFLPETPLCSPISENTRKIPESSLSYPSWQLVKTDAIIYLQKFTDESR